MLSDTADQVRDFPGVGLAQDAGEDVAPEDDQRVRVEEHPTAVVCLSSPLHEGPDPVLDELRGRAKGSFGNRVARPGPVIDGHPSITADLYEDIAWKPGEVPRPNGSISRSWVPSQSLR